MFPPFGFFFFIKKNLFDRWELGMEHISFFFFFNERRLTERLLGKQIFVFIFTLLTIMNGKMDFHIISMASMV